MDIYINSGSLSLKWMSPPERHNLPGGKNNHVKPIISPYTEGHSFSFCFTMNTYSVYVTGFFFPLLFFFFFGNVQLQLSSFSYFFSQQSLGWSRSTHQILHREQE